MSRSTTTILVHATARLIVAVGLCIGTPASAFAQPGLIDGRTFSEINLNAPVQEARLSLSAARVWSWREVNTERLLLDRGVNVSIGPYQFRAGKAVLWLEPIRIDGVDAEQLAVYFDKVSDPSGAVGLSQQGERLLVTAIIRRDEPVLKADLLRRERPTDPFVEESEARLARFLTELVSPPAAALPETDRTPGARPQAGAPAPRPPALPEWLTSDDRGPMPPADRIPAEEPRAGIVNFFADTIEIVRTERADEQAVLLTGGVAVQYVQVGDAYRPGPTVQLSAERAAVFLGDKADPVSSSFSADDVRGVYLEGDVVATTGRYTLRGSRVFYDVRTDRAVIVDAVFWTYDEERGMPLYLRADAIRQESINQWSAKNVRLANVGFAEPHFSIGATTVTITNAPRPGSAPGSSRAEQTLVDAKGVTFRFGETPVAWIPGLKGEPNPSILRSIAVDSEQGDPILRTAWDLYAIAGIEAAEGNQATLLLDGYWNRGPAAGLDIDWRNNNLQGSAFAYGIYDDGTDLLPSGSEISHEDDFRGMVEAEQIWRLADDWTLFLEASYISDETFVPAFFRSDAERRREFTNSAYLRYLDESSLFSFEVRGSLNDFVANQYLLQSLGYSTDKLPELAYYRVGDDLFGGLLSYSSETRLSAMRLNFTEPTMAELGFKTPAEARAAFGLAPDESIGDALRARGLDEDEHYRADTRHEIEMPLRWGAVNIVPFASGRATVWDDDFDDYAGKDNDPYRLWGAAGIRFATTIQKVDENVESAFLDLHRIRHLIEPSATIWTSGANLHQEDLPIYDDSVESIATGTAARAGVRNTWQTQRPAGAGGWRSVDWLVIDTNYVWSSGDVDEESPYGRFIEAQPEQSNLGRYLSNEAVLLLTDSVALTSDMIYDFENQTLARITAGAVIDHGYGFSTLAEYRYLDQPQSTLVDLGARYEFTRKYAAVLAGTIDADKSDFQDYSIRIERRFPQWTVAFRITVDNISDDVSIGVALRPAGFAGSSRTRPFTRDPLGMEADGGPTMPESDRLDWGPFRER